MTPGTAAIQIQNLLGGMTDLRALWFFPPQACDIPLPRKQGEFGCVINQVLANGSSPSNQLYELSVGLFLRLGPSGLLATFSELSTLIMYAHAGGTFERIVRVGGPVSGLPALAGAGIQSLSGGDLSHGERSGKDISDTSVPLPGGFHCWWYANPPENAHDGALPELPTPQH